MKNTLSSWRLPRINSNSPSSFLAICNSYKGEKSLARREGKHPPVFA
jgi:hypothetical protein